MTGKNNKKQIEDENKPLFESLYKSFKEKYNEQNSSAPFSNTNLFSTIHLSENDHTNILWDIIRYRKNGEYKFLNSFIKDCLGLEFEMKFEELEPKATQYQSLSNKKETSTDKKKYGYIDLLLKDDKKAIIIENKVCDAGDGKYQLARYYYTFAEIGDDANAKIGDDAKDLKELIDIPQRLGSNDNISDDNIYVVYLTKDDSKIFPAANTNSLPECLQKRLKLIQKEGKSIYDKNGSIPEDFSIPVDSHYIHISYSENILPWLKEKVLPEISAYKSDEFYRSVCLYVDYLENDVLGQTQQSRDIYLTDGYNKIVNDKTWKQLYKLLIEKTKQKFQTDAKNKTTDEDEDEYKYLNPYINFLRAQVTRKVNEAITTEGWKSYCTPSFVLFYKTEWYNPSSKYNIPPLNLLINPNKLIKLTESENVCFQIEHYSPKKQWMNTLIDELNKRIDKLNEQDKTLNRELFNKDNNRKNTPRLKDVGTITVNENKITIKLDKQLNIEDAIEKSKFPLYAK